LPVLIQTPRLQLRTFLQEDAALLYALNADEPTIRYTGDVPFSSPEAARKFIEGYHQYDRCGVGRWTTIRLSDGKPLGWCGLKYHPDADIYDLGFRFLREEWNKGYATEAASACLAFAWNTLHLSRIYARAMVRNTASIRVLEKLQMTPEKAITMEGEAAIYSRLPAPSFPKACHNFPVISLRVV
jgi:[ribosomal protein S5]-alanine N-acetyltransferase